MKHHDLQGVEIEANDKVPRIPRRRIISMICVPKATRKTANASIMKE